jgi:hypothetical protein
MCSLRWNLAWTHLEFIHKWANNNKRLPLDGELGGCWFHSLWLPSFHLSKANKQKVVCTLVVVTCVFLNWKKSNNMKFNEQLLCTHTHTPTTCWWWWWWHNWTQSLFLFFLHETDGWNDASRRPLLYVMLTDTLSLCLCLCGLDSGFSLSSIPDPQ